MRFAPLALCACGESLASSQADVTSPPSGAETWSTLAYVRAAACAGGWTTDVPARISFDEHRTARVGVPLAGRITAVVASRGQHVEAGAPLFTVTSGDLADLRAQRDKAAVELATANTNLERIRALVESSSIPGKELVTATQEMTEARLAVDTADRHIASLHLAGAGDTTFTVTAPQGGVIVDTHVAVGQQVSSDVGPVITIAELTDVWAYADVVDGTAPRLATGSRARITTDAGEVVDGTVDQVSAIVDPDRHTIPVRVTLDNRSGALRPGAYAEIRFFDEPTAAVCVPSTAVLSDGATRYVYVRQGGAIHRRDVALARASAGSTGIATGVALGDEIVAANGALLDNQLSD